MTHCLRIGVGGPIGSDKTALLRQLCEALKEHYDIAEYVHASLEINSKN